MKIGVKRMNKLLAADLDEPNWVNVNGERLYYDILDEGVEFRYGKKKLYISNDEPLIYTKADCQRLCDRVNKYFKIE